MTNDEGGLKSRWLDGAGLDPQLDQWIARCVARQLEPTGRQGLDQLLVTHLLPDHLGDVNESQPVSSRGRFRLTGVMDVAERMDIGTVVDRGWPDDNGTIPKTVPFLADYLALVRARSAADGRVERFEVGRDDQFGSGRADPTSASATRAKPWRDVLTAVARVAGPADVATADRHGMFDGLSADAVRAWRPRCWIVQAWHLAHPDTLQLERMLSTRLYPGPRDATNELDVVRTVSGPHGASEQCRQGEADTILGSSWRSTAK